MKRMILNNNMLLLVIMRACSAACAILAGWLLAFGISLSRLCLTSYLLCGQPGVLDQSDHSLMARIVRFLGSVPNFQDLLHKFTWQTSLEGLREDPGPWVTALLYAISICLLSVVGSSRILPNVVRSCLTDMPAHEQVAIRSRWRRTLMSSPPSFFKRVARDAIFGFVASTFGYITATAKLCLVRWVPYWNIHGMQGMHRSEIVFGIWTCEEVYLVTAVCIMVALVLPMMEGRRRWMILNASGLHCTSCGYPSVPAPSANPVVCSECGSTFTNAFASAESLLERWWFLLVVAGTALGLLVFLPTMFPSPW